MATENNGGLGDVTSMEVVVKAEEAVTKTEEENEEHEEQSRSRPKKKKKSGRHKRKTSDRREYVMESKKEKEAEAREWRKALESREFDELQEYRYMAVIKEQLLQEDNPDAAAIKPTKRPSKKKSKKASKKRARVESADGDWECGPGGMEDGDDDDVVLLKVVAQPTKKQSSSTEPICLDEDAIPRRHAKPKPATSAMMTSVQEEAGLQRPTQFRLSVVKASYHHEYKIPFELTEEEYQLLLTDAPRGKCPKYADVLEGKFPTAPSAHWCAKCHSMMFLYHCQQAILSNN
ncbi:hypothetical protein DYB37_006429 [Aphanomyces astaci]|uniref:Uncharacterized protein n=2 Tax=Aphanomyces astaci TaxID=112090 RepID=A0A3R6WI20_APHAT|nr:hypothetical protein DYB35_005250 [Aphanomyces astaci]RHZ05189.1 hypothetical protein DYB37_006429 [Aphanomyces astaci]